MIDYIYDSYEDTFGIFFCILYSFFTFFLAVYIGLENSTLILRYYIQISFTHCLPYLTNYCF